MWMCIRWSRWEHGFRSFIFGFCWRRCVHSILCRTRYNWWDIIVINYWTGQHQKPTEKNLHRMTHSAEFIFDCNAALSVSLKIERQIDVFFSSYFPPIVGSNWLAAFVFEILRAGATPHDVVDDGQAKRDLQIFGAMATVFDELERPAGQTISLGIGQFHRGVQQ